MATRLALLADGGHPEIRLKPAPDERTRKEGGLAPAARLAQPEKLILKPSRGLEATEQNVVLVTQQVHSHLQKLTHPCLTSKGAPARLFSWLWWWWGPPLVLPNGGSPGPACGPPGDRRSRRSVYPAAPAMLHRPSLPGMAGSSSKSAQSVY